MIWTHGYNLRLRLHYSNAILSAEQAERILTLTVEFLHKTEDEITLDFLFNEVLIK